MNYLFTVCGRAGSKGFKNKNLKSMLGVPLVYYTLAAICLYKKEYGMGDNIYVAVNTDSNELIELVRGQQGLDVLVIQRAGELAGDQIPKVLVVKDCLVRAQEAYGVMFDLVVDLDLTSPLRTVKDIRAAVEKKNARAEVDVVYSVTTSRRNPYFNMVKEEEGFFVKAVASDYVTRQQAPIFYDMNASIYAYAPRALASKKADGFFNDNADAVVMRDTAVLDIDSEEDFELMGIIADYLIKTYLEYKEIFDCALYLARSMEG